MYKCSSTVMFQKKVLGAWGDNPRYHQTKNNQVIFVHSGCDKTCNQKVSYKVFQQKSHASHQQDDITYFSLVGGWTNPFEKICSSKWVHLSPKIRGEKHKNLWVCHHLSISYLKKMNHLKAFISNKKNSWEFRPKNSLRMTPGSHGDGCTLGGTTCGSLAGGISEPRRRMAEAPGSPRGWDVKFDVFWGGPKCARVDQLLMNNVKDGHPTRKNSGNGCGPHQFSRASV